MAITVSYCEIDPSGQIIVTMHIHSTDDDDNPVTVQEVKAAVENNGRIFDNRTDKEMPNPSFHRFNPATKKYEKRPRSDFGPPPSQGQPDNRPDPARFPDPPSS